MYTLDDNIDFKETIETLEGKYDSYKIRLLDGVDSARLANLKEFVDQALYILANCLLDGKTERPVGKEIAYRFLRGRYIDAITIINTVLGRSNKEEAEEDAAVDLEKNDSDGTGGRSTESDSVNDSD